MTSKFFMSRRARNIKTFYSSNDLHRFWESFYVGHAVNMKNFRECCSCMLHDHHKHLAMFESRKFGPANFPRLPIPWGMTGWCKSGNPEIPESVPVQKCAICRNPETPFPEPETPFPVVAVPEPDPPHFGGVPEYPPNMVWGPYRVSKQ